MRLLYIYLIFFLLLSCKKDSNKDLLEINIDGNKGVLINNEGNYGWSNASLSYYNLKTGEVTPDIFKQVNGLPLGDVCQSVSFYNDRFYIVVNNSNRIEIVNSSSFKSTGSIHNLTSPRYILPISPNKAYISDMYENKITVLKLSDNSIIKKIICQGSTEEMLLSGNKVFVTNTKKKFVYLLDTLLDAITDSILVGTSPFSIRTDKNGKVWVLCAGITSPVVNGSLCKINPTSGQVELKLDFSNPINVWNKLRMNGSKDTLYFANGGVFQMPIIAASLPQSPLIPNGSKNFYGLGIQPDNGNIFVSDAIDYIQQGKVFIYEPGNGSLVKSFNAGIIPGDFLFN